MPTTNLTAVMTPEVVDFGSDEFPDCPYILVEVNGQNLNASNKKLRLGFGDVQLTILPRHVRSEGRAIFHKGQLARAQAGACGERCVFRVKDPDYPHRLGKCYVNRIWSAADKVKRFYEADEPRLLTIYSNALVRCSVWGDLGALPPQAQQWVKRLLDHTSGRLVYVSDFERVAWLKGYGLASVQTDNHVHEALSLGLKCYAGSLEAWQALRDSNEVVYKCPVKGDGLDKFGCSTCPIKCNGERHVVAYTVHTNG